MSTTQLYIIEEIFKETEKRPLSQPILSFLGGYNLRAAFQSLLSHTAVKCTNFWIGAQCFEYAPRHPTLLVPRELLMGFGPGRVSKH